MANVKTNSPLSRRIVIAFLDFLNSVEAASDVDHEALQVARECLSEAFKVELSSVESVPKSDSLTDIFSTRIAVEQREIKSDLSQEELRADAPSTSKTHNGADTNIAETSRPLGEDGMREAHALGMSEDELFGQYFAALENIHYFGIAPDGHEDQVQLDRATLLFHNALKEMKDSGCQIFDQKNLAETFKSQGNKAMQSKLYSDAIQLYTLAIALSKDNAVYYCNRAAAYTQMNQCTEAIRDCYKSIEIDPTYSKAYSRLGFAYYVQGNYRDSIDEGFMKALQLDPNNEFVKENIRMAEQKLKEGQQRAEHNQNSGSAGHFNQQSTGTSWSHGSPPPFASMPFNINGLPADMADMFVNMTANAYQGQHSQGSSEGGNNTTDTFSEPEVRIGGANINVNLGDRMPEEISGALRSVMEMFSGAAAQRGNSQDNLNGRSAQS